MEIKQQQSVLQKLINTFRINQQQIGFGAYAAELSFYVIWSLIPLILSLANVVAVLPIDQGDFIMTVQRVLPDEVEPAIMPLLTSYLDQTSTGIFSIGLIISLWPASNIYNTIQRVFNNIYKVEEPPNAIIGRLFAYIMTVIAVIGGIAFSFVLVFGETVLNFIENTFHLNLTFLDYLIQSSPFIAFVAVLVVLILMYHFIPNVNWSIKYAIPGAVFAMIGFILVSQLFTIYLSFTKHGASNGTMGVFVVFVIWLYFNTMILAVGAFLNVFIHDYFEVSHLVQYKGLGSDDTEPIQSENYRDHVFYQKHFVDKIYKPESTEMMIEEVVNDNKGARKVNESF